MSDMNTINQLIDDSSPIEIISLVDEPLQNSVICDLIVKENKLFANVIEKCLNVTDSKGMIRVLNRMVIPAYKELDENYSKSQNFEKVLKKTLKLLEFDPFCKFSHLRDLYETLKLHKVRKKVNLVTLETNLKETSASTKRMMDWTHNLSKKPKVDIIDLVDDNPPVINVDNYEYDVVLLDDRKVNLDEKSDQIKPLPSKCDKDNNLVTFINKNREPNDTKPNEGINIEVIVDEASTFLIPRTVETCYEEYRPTEAEKVLVIENEIARYKEMISILEEKEVDDDSMESPYILSENYKAKVVQLYKELCELTGADSVKRREVRLKVNDGHPPGPVQRLEKFLNNNIGSNGVPPFPDFRDVVQCVVISNTEDELGWNRSQIMKEATALFTQCGRALQQRRQKREWRDLMCRVKLERCDTDPAENSPELEARLQENRRIAMKREADILESFSKLQNFPLSQIEKKGGKFNNILTNSETGTENETEAKDKNENNDRFEEAVEHEETNSSDTNHFIHNNGEVNIKTEPVEDVVKLLEGLGENYTTTIKDIEDPFLIIEISSDSSSDGE